MSTFTTHRGSLSLPLRRVATQNRERPGLLLLLLIARSARHVTSLATTTTPFFATELVVRGA